MVEYDTKRFFIGVFLSSMLAKEKMPQDMFRDLHRLINFVDNFGEE